MSPHPHFSALLCLGCLLHFLRCPAAGGAAGGRSSFLLTGSHLNHVQVCVEQEQRFLFLPEAAAIEGTQAPHNLLFLGLMLCVCLFLNEGLQSYYEKFCSTRPAGTPLSFAVRVTGQQQVLFSNKFCNEDEVCEPTPPEDLPKDGTGDTQCPTCIKSDADTCGEELQRCSDGERCVDLLVEITTDGSTQQTALKGCSNINDDACNQLSEGNVVLGDITFQRLACTTPNPISTPEQTTTPDSSTTTTPSTTSNSSSSSNTTATPSTTSNSSSSSNTTGTLSTNSNSSSNTTTFPTTTDSSGLSQAAKLPWIASLVLGLLLL